MADLLTLSDDPKAVVSAVEEARDDVRYVVVDFTLELLVSKFKEHAESEGDIYIPEYQRPLAWSDEQASYLIESLILRVPVPPLFFYDVEGKLEIVDGSQRMRSVVRFVSDQFSLRSLDRLDVLNGYHFSDLPLSIHRRLMNTPIRSFVMDQGTDESTRIDLFRRLNTSGKRLQDSEIRKGAFQGPFLNLIVTCADSKLFTELTPTLGGYKDSRGERQELVTRYFVYLDHYQKFQHDVRRFLDNHVVTANKSYTGAKLQSLADEFDRTMNFVRQHFKTGFYKTEGGRTVPRVRFEAIAVGTALALRQNPAPHVGNTSWTKSPEFEGLVRTDASNSAPKLRARIEFVRDKLLGQN
jgi:hypothetical protein